jgi:hypothetical protein
MLIFTYTAVDGLDSNAILFLLSGWPTENQLVGPGGEVLHFETFTHQIYHRAAVERDLEGLAHFEW